MANRAPRGRIPKEVQAIFEKYQNSNVRQLNKDDAIHMLRTEFNLSEQQADQMFNTFDKDMNGIMSIWEFQQFYQVVGGSAADMVAKFTEIDADGSGKLDVEEARAGLKAMTVSGGHVLQDKEIDFFLKSSLGDDNLIDLGHFANLLFRLKLYKPPPKKHI